MSQESLENFGAYRLAMELFDFVMRRGSARETRGRYLRMKHWLPAYVIQDRVRRCDAILGNLSKTIVSLRCKASAPSTLALQAPPPSSHA